MDRSPCWRPNRRTVLVGAALLPLSAKARETVLTPGQKIPFTVAWHAKDGEPAVVDYGAGSLRVPG